MPTTLHRCPVLVTLLVLGARESVAESADPGVGRFGFDCESDYSQWETVWSEAKKQWCCQYVKRGCNVTYDCKEGLNSWQSKWSKDKKNWCCERKNLGCRWDCLSDSELWSPGHRTWCCKNHKEGCLADEEAEEEQKGHFDCRAGVALWRTGWSDRKKAYCCKTFPPNGCPQESKYDCKLGSDTWQMGWPAAKKQWCCQVKPPNGCPRTEPYDCDAGKATWQKSWTSIKKEWCCTEHPPEGCPEDATTKPYGGAEEEYQSQPTSVPPAQQSSSAPAPPAQHPSTSAQLPSTVVPPTPPPSTPVPPAQQASTPAPVEPAASLAQAQQSTTSALVRQPTTKAPQKYDCFADFEQRTSWCKKKICWCCEFHGVACPPVYYPPNVPENVVICPHVPHEEAAKEAAALNGVQGEAQLTVRMPEAQHTQRNAVLVGGLVLTLSLSGLLMTRALAVRQRRRRGTLELLPVKDLQELSLHPEVETAHLTSQDLRAVT